MDRYVQSRRKDGVKNSTIRRELTDIKAILNWAVKRRPPMIPFNPVRDYKKPAEDDAITLPPTDAEIKALFDVLSNNHNAHVNRFVKMFCYLGARSGYKEILTITWRQVSWQARSARIFSAEKGGPRSRQVPIHDAFYNTLRSWWVRRTKEKRLTLYHFGAGFFIGFNY